MPSKGQCAQRPAPEEQTRLMPAPDTRHEGGAGPGLDVEERSLLSFQRPVPRLETAQKKPPTRARGLRGCESYQYESGLEAPWSSYRVFLRRPLGRPKKYSSFGLPCQPGETALADLQERARERLARNVEPGRRLAVHLHAALLDQAAGLRGRPDAQSARRAAPAGAPDRRSGARPRARPPAPRGGGRRG